MGQITNLRPEQAEESEAQSLGAMRFIIAEFQLPASYTNPGGTPGFAAAMGLRAGSIEAVVPLNKLGYIWEYHPETDSIKVYQQPAAAAAGASPEVPNATNLSAAGTVRALIIFKSAGY